MVKSENEPTKLQCDQTEPPSKEDQQTKSQRQYRRYLLFVSLGLIFCCSSYGGATIWGWLDDPTSYTPAEAIFTLVLVGSGYSVSLLAVLKRRQVLVAIRQRHRRPPSPTNTGHQS
jgi:hypothetical protein